MGGSWHRLLGQHILQTAPGGPHAERALRLQALARGVHGRPVLESPQPPGRRSHAMEQLQHEIQASVQHQTLPAHKFREDLDRPRPRVDSRAGVPVSAFRVAAGIGICIHQVNSTVFSSNSLHALVRMQLHSKFVGTYLICSCPKLKVLGLPNLFRQDERHVPGLIGKWKGLEFLSMGKKPSTFTRIIEQISLNCNNFTGLRLSGRVSREHALAIVDHLPRLKYLAMSGCSLSKRELLAILDGCKELEAVDVSNCTGFVVDDEITRIASFIRDFKYEGAKMGEDYMCYSMYYDENYMYDGFFWGMVS
ncbi:F-box/LRR-repeat protein-like [Iris pallida]|uniref:F-box/LRR-repeat protein-like n=1 Tax=Iris pallida TaxID=29817 RepID=A0AAX6DYE6_IRIPA|nr:F-box/LRR-repeat protein-like [Iris pallida]